MIRWYMYWRRIYFVLLIINVLLLVHYIISHQSLGDIGYDINAGPSLYFNANKKKELLDYALGVVFVFIAFIMFILQSKYKFTYGRVINLYLYDIYRSGYGAIYLVFMFVIPLVIGLGVESSRYRVYGQFIVVSIILVILFSTSIEKAFSKGLFGGVYRSKIFWGITILVASIQLISLFTDVLFKDPKVINEYHSLPEITILDSLCVYNTPYFNSHFKSAVTNKNDVVYGRKYDNYVSVGAVDEKKILKYDKNILACDGDLGRLYLNGLIDTAVVREVGIESLVDLNKRHEEIDKLLLLKKYDDEERKYMKNNEYEYRWQIFERFIVHHHNFVLSPVNELLLGRPKEKIVAQYGLGSAMIISELLKASGGISMQGWYRLWSLFYILYYFSFLVVLIIVFKDLRLVSVVYVMSIALLNMRGYDFILLAPGESPWRNFFDVFIVGGLYLYQKNYSKIILLVLMAFGLLSLYINPQMGLMIYFSLLVVITFDIIYDKQDLLYRGVVVFLYVVAGVYVYSVFPTYNPLGKYYIDGLLGFHVPFEHIVAVYVVLGVGYWMLYKAMVVEKNMPYLMVMFSFVYAQSLLVYALWHYNYDGVLPRSHMYVLAVVFIVYYCRDMIKRPLLVDYKNVIGVTLSVFVILFYSQTIVGVERQRKAYNNIFKTHKTYLWPFERYRIVSTVDPVVFSNDVKMIERYVPANTKGMYMISEYDNILPFLASKYSEMPFIDLKWYLLTKKEMDKSAECIKSAAPRYIFVDNDIKRNYNDDIIDPKFYKIGWLYEESVWRVQRHRLMAELFKSIENSYVQKERGTLITVYERKWL